MEEHAEQMSNTVRVLAYLLKEGRVDPDKELELYFASNPSPESGAVKKTSTALQQKIDKHEFTDESFDIGASLGNIVTHVLKKDTPCNIYVLTNGHWGSSVPGDLCGVDRPINRLVNAVEEAGLEDNWFGVQFIRFYGRQNPHDDIGKQRLDFLDKEVGKM